MKLLKLDALLTNAIQQKRIEYIIDFVDCYLKNKDNVVVYNIVDIKLYELWKNKAEWLSVIDNNSDIERRLKEMFDKLAIYFW